MFISIFLVSFDCSSIETVFNFLLLFELVGYIPCNTNWTIYPPPKKKLNEEIIKRLGFFNSSKNRIRLGLVLNWVALPGIMDQIDFLSTWKIGTENNLEIFVVSNMTGISFKKIREWRRGIGGCGPVTLWMYSPICLSKVLDVSKGSIQDNILNKDDKNLRSSL